MYGKITAKCLCLNVKGTLRCLYPYNSSTAFTYFAASMAALKQILLALMLSVTCMETQGQIPTTYWESPETEQLYNTAKEALSRGAIKQAIVLFQQVADREPGAAIVKRDLAQALLLAGERADAAATIEPLIESGQADEQSYQIAGSAWLQSGERKKAKKALQAGIKRYPQSGIIYHELGKYYEEGADLEYALDAWLQGIQVDPDYYLNYYEAARIYAGTSKPVWTILYGEIFVNKERQTPRSYEMRKMMLEAYRQIFTTKIEMPDTSDIKFDDAVTYTLLQLAPVVGDGITVENLTMLRTRFVMDWMGFYGQKYPYSLFTYQENLLQEGHFDAYNQWLFGKAENAGQYEAWIKFHTAAVPSMEKWVTAHRFQPTASDSYNDRELRALFIKKRK